MMRLAIDEAKKGAMAGEIPVGAILVHDGQVIGKGFNQPILSHDPTAHAEIVALRDACTQLNNYRLPPQTTLYVTLEPCTMCFGALVHARVARIVFATFEPKSGVVGSQLDLSQMGFYNHQATVSHGLLACECSQMLSQFFAQRRADKRLAKQMAISKV
nr:tRNA adenosine(34) deaminase TadA [Moraxella pluranimalium]